MGLNLDSRDSILDTILSPINIAEQFQLLSDFGHADKLHPLDYKILKEE
jgi:hypothetical protein